MAQGTTVSETIVKVWDENMEIRVKVGGSGAPLLYLHPAAGLYWDPFIEQLSKHYTVYAPEHPGTSADDPDAIHKVDSFWELLLMYEELVRKLGLERSVLMGQSYGGMMAADLAASFPGMFSKVVLTAPIGLWRDDAPIPLVELASSMPDKLVSMLFHDPKCPAAVTMLTPPDDPELAIKAGAGMVWAIGCTGKFFWPIADYGLARRLFRVSAPTLIVWGRHDSLVPVIYAEEFAKRIADSRVAIIENAGHIPQMEQTEATYAAVTEFLA